MTTTLYLAPKGLSPIYFGRDAAQAVDGYYAATDTLELNESDRVEFLYSDTRYGGRAISQKTNLVDISFTVFIIGADKNSTLQKAHNLNKAIMAGGDLVLQVHNADRATYYLYEPSPPCEIVDKEKNKWDYEYPFHHGEYVVALEVTLKTKPLGQSEYTIAVDEGTVSNSGVNYVDVTNSYGDVSALMRLKVKPSSSSLSRLYICTRSSILSNLADVVQMIEAESWDGMLGNTTVVDDLTGGYSDGSAIGITIADIDEWYGVSIPLSNEIEHRGLIGILVGGSFPASTVFQMGYALDGNEIWRDVREFPLEVSDTLVLTYVGEHHLPPIAHSPSTILTNPQLNFYFKSGVTGEAIIDNFFLVFSDEVVLQVDIGNLRSDSISSSQTLKLETNTDNDRIAHIYTNLDLSGVAKNVVGNVLLEIKEDTRIYFMWERTGGVYNPADELNVTVELLHRTIVPFGA